MAEAQEPWCGGCGALQSQVSLFFIPGGWGWNDDEHDGRQGLCLRCGQGDPRYRELFSRHFPNVRVVTDSDSAEAADRLDPGQPEG